MDNDDQIAYLTGDLSARLTAEERAELDGLRAVLTDPATWVEPDPALQERIVAAVVQARDEDHVAASTTDRPADITGGTRRRSRWIPYGVIGVAAAAVLALGLAVGLSGPKNSPVHYAASLGGTSLAPRASGEVTLTQTASGWKIHLHAAGLPRRADGEFYEAWLKNEAGVLVPIGTFNQGDDVILWAGVPPSSFPILTVTREEADGDQSSSGQVVVMGTAHRTH
jgi:hypothetical protein